MASMTKVELIRVFLASPGDVDAERAIVRQVLDAVNQTVGKDKGVRFELVSWETDSVPSYGRDAQAILNDQIGDMTTIELFVGIMWNRFGSATPRAESGTEEEFRRAVESLQKTGKPEIMFYFNRAPSDASTSEEAEQKVKVLKFKEEMRTNGLTQDYSGPEEFRELFRSHLEKWLFQHRPALPTVFEGESNLGAANKPSTGLSQPVQAVEESREEQTVETVNNSDMWLLLGSKFFLASEVNEVGARKVILKIPVSQPDEDAFFRSLQPSQFGRTELMPFAHQHTGGLAKVSDLKRSSAGTDAVWDLTLELQEVNTGFGSDMAYGAVSAGEIATLRAKLILLNQKPQQFPNNQLEDTFFQTFVFGISTSVKATSSALPLLWKDAKGDSHVFLRVARLWSVFHLISTNTCEHILELILGPIKDGKMHVRFRGQRKKVYSNRDAFIIEVEGDCDLSSN
jgi:hypothetical protein